MSKIIETQEDELFKKFKEERQKEVDGLKAPQKDAAKQMLNSMLRDKLSAKESSFTPKGQKSAGVSSGYVATETETGDTFILKHFYKSNKDVPSGPKEKQNKQDRQDAVRELLGSTMYQLLLYDRAPKEGLVIPDKEKPNHLYVRSKFFTNVTSLSEFSGLDKGHTHIESSNKLKALKGLEKVSAACDLLREIDYHGGNLMVQDDGTINKIDHGRSFIAQYRDFGGMVEARHQMFSGCGYTQAIKDGNLSFNIEEYGQALKQMLERCDKQQMEAIIDKRFDELEKAGFDPTGTTVFPVGKKGAWDINEFRYLKKSYKEQISDSISVMRDIAKSTEIISKFSDMPDKFRNGGWLEEFAKSNIKDPVAYAAHHNIKIDGQNALEWAYNNHYKIKVPEADMEEDVTVEKWQKNYRGKWAKGEEVVGRGNSIRSSEMDPMQYIASTKLRGKQKLSESEEEFLVRATQLNLTDGSRTTLTSISASYGFTPSQEATARVRSQDQANIDALTPLVDNLAEEATKSNLTAKRVTEFYDALLSNLEKQGYITKQDVANIKKDQDYVKQAKETADLINAETPTIGCKEKVYYRVAGFAKAVGLSGVSEYFRERIPTEKLAKIHAIETALSHSVKTGVISKSIKPIVQTKKLEKLGTDIQTKLKTRRGR